MTNEVGHDLAVDRDIDGGAVDVDDC